MSIGLKKKSGLRFSIWALNVLFWKWDFKQTETRYDGDANDGDDDCTLVWDETQEIVVSVSPKVSV